MYLGPFCLLEPVLPTYMVNWGYQEIDASQSGPSSKTDGNWLALNRDWQKVAYRRPSLLPRVDQEPVRGLFHANVFNFST